MFYVYATLAIVALTVAIVTAAYLLRDAYRRRRLVLIAPIIVVTPVLTAFPSDWIADVVPAGTNYWGGANPLAVMVAWPSLTAIAYGVMWWIIRPDWRD